MYIYIYTNKYAKIQVWIWLNFTYGIETRHYVGIAQVPNLSHCKMTVLNLRRVTESNKNEYWFLRSGYLKGTLHHYKMKIGIYMLLSSGYLKGALQHYKVTMGKDMFFDGWGFKEALTFLTKMASSGPTGLPWRAWKCSNVVIQESIRG